MSGVVKGVKKVFKKVGSAAKKLWKNKIVRAIVIAAAIYFTGGLAAGAMGSTTAAAMPGITAAAKGLGITAGAFGTGAGTFAAGSTGLLMPAAEAAAEIGAATSAAEGATLLSGAEAAAPIAADAVAPGLVESVTAPTVQAPTAPMVSAEALAPIEASAAEVTTPLLDATPSVAQASTPLADSAGLVSSQAADGSWIPQWFKDLPPAAQQVVLQSGVEGVKGLGAAYMGSQEEKELERQRAEFQNRFNLPEGWAEGVVSWKGGDAKADDKASTTDDTGAKAMAAEQRTTSQGAKPMKTAEQRLAGVKKQREDEERDRRLGLVERSRAA